MTAAELLDHDWYLDHVLVVSEPGGGRVGPVRLRQSDWMATARDLTDESRGTDLAEAVMLACQQGLVLSHDQALACGVSASRTRSLVRTRRWSRPRRGVLCPLPPVPPTPARTAGARAVQPHGQAVQIQATAAALVRPGTVISNESAAAIHGLPLIDRVPRPTMSAVQYGRTVSRSDVIVRGVGLGNRDLAVWFGARVTDVDRTVMDVARSSGTAAALAMADAALNDRQTSLGRLHSARAKYRYRPGIRTADRVLELADHRAESPLESLVRLCLADGGLPTPELQVLVDTDCGTFRVDMLFGDSRLIVEADGELKYDPARDPYALINEKRRQEALERAGYTVVRVSWRDVRHEPLAVIARVRWNLQGGGL